MFTGTLIKSLKCANKTNWHRISQKKKKKKRKEKQIYGGHTCEIKEYDSGGVPIFDMQSFLLFQLLAYTNFALNSLGLRA